MKNCTVVIGSLWGDEGKGHMTDILCTSPNTLNVRFNGGAQASHTVVTPDNKRHAFSHFGAGTFAGAKTFLSEYFIVNPMKFCFERTILVNNFQIQPCEFVHPNCIVTTPWDIYINQAVEVLRGDLRHGSCGMGINETVKRSKLEKYKITVFDLLFPGKLLEKLYSIQNEYVSFRLKNEYNLKIEDLPDEYIKAITDSENIDMFMFFVKEFLSNITIHENGFINKFDNIVFEGAQGLLLDQNNTEYFPHVTTSNTGIKNVMNILNSINYNEKINIYYMSRCYLTRHGAGPFKNELESKPYSKIEDLTNVSNDFQGNLRFGYLDFDLLSYEINKDLKNISIPANINIVFTCLDQLDECFKYYNNNTLNIASKNTFLKIAWSILSAKVKNLNNILATNGFTRDNFIKYIKS